VKTQQNTTLEANDLSDSIMLQGTAGPFEAFVSQWLSMKGYLVQNPVNYRPIGRKSWSDIDIVGTKGNEVVIVECKEWISGSKQKTIREIEQKFSDAKEFLDSVGLTKDKTVSFIFAQIDKDSAFEKLLMTSSKRIGKSIKYADFVEMTDDFYKGIRPYITDTHIGKFGEPISWLFSRLIYYDYIKPKNQQPVNTNSR
jgi:Holliday junction resolvase-like predicted endonuclease